MSINEAKLRDLLAEATDADLLWARGEMLKKANGPAFSRAGENETQTAREHLAVIDTVIMERGLKPTYCKFCGEPLRLRYDSENYWCADCETITDATPLPG